MATVMPPWQEWQLQYIGTRFLGRLLAQWTVFWIRPFKKLFELISSGDGKSNGCTRLAARRSPAQETPQRLFAKTFGKMAISTLFMLAVLRLATLKPVWVATDKSEHRFLAAILLLAPAVWLVSLVWIGRSLRQLGTGCNEQPGHRFTGSTHAKAR